MHSKIPRFIDRNRKNEEMNLIERKLEDKFITINERKILEVAKFIIEKYGENPNLWELLRFTEEKKLGYGMIDAAKFGYIKLVKLFLEKGADINYRRYPKSCNALETASVNGHLEVVKYLYENGGKDEESINRAFLYSCENRKFDVAEFFIRQEGTKIRKESILLRWLLRNNCLEILKLVDENNISLNYSDINEEMIFAWKNGNIRIIKMLIELGADINYETGYGKNAMVYATIYRQFEVVKYLYNLGFTSEFYINIAFLFACENGDFEIAEYLITKGVKINFLDYGETALMRASKKGCFEMVEFLLEKGAVMSYKNNNGDTALNFAIKNNDMEMVTFLIQKGAVLSNDKSTEKILINAVLKEKIEIVRFLLENKVNPDIRDNRGRTLIELIIGHYKGEAILLELIKYKVNLLILDSDKNSYLISAINNNLPKIAKILIENKLDINHKNIYGGDALIYAARHGNLEILNLLIKNGANINSLKNNKTNALFALLYKDKSALLMREIFRYLIEHGINILQRNTHFEIPVETVFARGDFELGIDILQDMIDAGLDPYEQNNKGEDLFCRLSKIIKDPSKYLHAKTKYKQLKQVLLKTDKKGVENNER